MRVATFNILNGRTPTESSVDEARYADAIASLDADVLALQEVDRDQPRSGGADLTAIAAEAMGAVDHRFEPVLRGLPATGSRPPARAARRSGVRHRAAQPLSGAADGRRSGCLGCGRGRRTCSRIRGAWCGCARNRVSPCSPSWRRRSAGCAWSPPICPSCRGATATSCGHWSDGSGSPRCRRSSPATSTSAPVGLRESPGCGRWRSGLTFPSGRPDRAARPHPGGRTGCAPCPAGPCRCRCRTTWPRRRPAARPVAAVSRAASG